MKHRLDGARIFAAMIVGMPAMAAAEPWVPEPVVSATLEKFVGGTDSYVQPHRGMTLEGFEKGTLRLRGGAKLPTAFLAPPADPVVQGSDDLTTIRYTLAAHSYRLPEPRISARGLPRARYVCGFDLPRGIGDPRSVPDQKTTITLVTRGSSQRTGRLTIAHQSRNDGGLVYVAVFRCRVDPRKLPPAEDSERIFE